VPRRGQVLSKPEFFEYLQKQRLAEDSLVDASAWLSSTNHREHLVADAKSIQIKETLQPCNRWRPIEIALDVAPMLRLRSMGTRTGLSSLAPPSTWVHFGQFKFDGPTDGGVRSRPLGETDLEDVEEMEEDATMLTNKKLDAEDGLAPGWLVEDDIEDF
jgi:cell cycle checkpoint protein